MTKKQSPYLLTTKKPRSHKHHDELKKFFTWIAWQGKTIYPLRCIYAVPNANTTFGDIKKLMWMKAEGLQAGVPDVNMDYPSGNYHGLRMELKIGKDTLSDAQLVWKTK